MKSKEELQNMYNNADELEKLLAAHVITNELLCDIRGLLVSINQKLIQCPKKFKTKI